MKNRLVSLFTLCVILLSGAFFIGCEDTATLPEPSFFGQIRVMNFSVCAGVSSYDVYLYPENAAPDTIAKALGLAYGIATPYITNLGTNKGAGQNYTLVVRGAGAKSGDLIKTTILIKPNDKWTFVVLSEAGDGTPEYKLINDNPTSPAVANMAYFRFMNTMPGSDPGDITVRIDDPISGTPLTLNPVAYKNISDYEGIQTATDKTVTFYAVRTSDNVVLGRLAGVSLEGGSYTTMTWGGNCPEKYRPQEDGVLIRDDSSRIRLFGDSGVGNDVTIPVPSTMRINYVNALVNPNVPESDPRFTALHYQHLGVVIDNDTRYNFPSMTPFSVGPAPTKTEVLPNGSIYYENNPISFPLNDAVNVKGFKMDPAQPDVRGVLLFDYRAGVRADIKSDMLTTFVVHDSIRFVKKLSADKRDTSYLVSALDSARGQFIIAVPDVPDANNPTIVLANALAPGYKSSATVTNVKFYLNDAQETTTGNWSPKKYQTVKMPTPPGTYTVKATLNTTPVEEFSTTFTADAGGIYEVLLVGERNHTNSNFQPRFIVLRVNPK
ncbi:MAG TPA: hypothetical protein VIX80_04995 [Candidatus Kapabacteria bacterium]